MSGCKGCSGNCGGCGKVLELSQGEIDLLRALEQLALLAQENGEDLEQFLKALQPGAEEG